MNSTPPNLLPFNLAKALEGHPTITRSGIKVVQLFYAEKSDIKQKLIAVLENGELYYYTTDGTYLIDGNPNSKDLFLVDKSAPVAFTYELWLTGNYYCKAQLGSPGLELILFPKETTKATVCGVEVNLPKPPTAKELLLQKKAYIGVRKAEKNPSVLITTLAYLTKEELREQANWPFNYEIIELTLPPSLI